MDYHEMRRRFEPTTVRLVLLAESPPAPNGKGESKYFYDPTGSTSESLFEATMKALEIDCCDDKEKGLREFQRRGVLLLDVSYTPVNKYRKSNPDKYVEILEDSYDDLLGRLSKLPDGVPIVIVLKGIYDRFFHRLRNAGFNVVDEKIRFPSHRKDRVDEFGPQLKRIAAKHGICQP